MVKRIPVLAAILLVLLTWASPSFAQKNKATKKTTTQKKPASQQNTAPVKKVTPPKPEAKATETGNEEGKVKDIITFLEYMLNTIGDDSTAVADKDVMITESFSKVFRDDQVQIQDDLDEERKVITNKNVVSYLKDVDFFFKDVKFSFSIEGVQKSQTSSGNEFFKVTTRRTITGVSAEGAKVSNSIPRFIEINYDPKAEELKIVSIYTNEFDESAALNAWWSELSHEWRSILAAKIGSPDSIDVTALKKITAVQELDLTGNKLLANLEPLSQLPDLKLLDISYTNITDLTPLRNLAELIELDLSNTQASDLSPLRYCTKLQRLNLSNTFVADIGVLEKMPSLQYLHLAGSLVQDFTVVGSLTNLNYLNLRGTSFADPAVLSALNALVELNLSQTKVADLSTLAGKAALAQLFIDSTVVANLNPLSQAPALKILHANYSNIADLSPLSKHPTLTTIYCDQTRVTALAADAFMAANKKVLVIYDSRELQMWWDSLSPAWQNVLRHSAGINGSPSKEQLVIISNVDSINVSRNTNISNLQPLKRLTRLKKLNASQTAVQELGALAELRELVSLDLSETMVINLEPLAQLPKLKIVNLTNSKFETLMPLSTAPAIEKIYADHTILHDITAKEFLDARPTSLLVYKTSHLKRWWTQLPVNLKMSLAAQVRSDTLLTPEDLHNLAERTSLQLDGVDISDLSWLREFVRLEKLSIQGSFVRSFPNLDNLQYLKLLHLKDGPLQNIESIGRLSLIEDLDISNSAVEDLKSLAMLENLKRLNCSGTQIRKLDALEKIDHLEQLDCSNTRVANLQPIMELNLKVLKCYNTKVSAREAEKFKENNRDCNVIYYR